MISGRGDQSNGPTTKPITMIDQVRMATSKETLCPSSIRPKPPVTTDEPNAMHTTRAEAIRVMYHRNTRLQSWGFSGSPIVKVTNSTGPSTCCFSTTGSAMEFFRRRLATVEALVRICSRVAWGTRPVAVSRVYSSGKTGGFGSIEDGIVGVEGRGGVGESEVLECCSSFCSKELEVACDVVGRVWRGFGALGSHGSGGMRWRRGGGEDIFWMSVMQIEAICRSATTSTEANTSHHIYFEIFYALIGQGCKRPGLILLLEPPNIFRRRIAVREFWFASQPMTFSGQEFLLSSKCPERRLHISLEPIVSHILPNETFHEKRLPGG